jgi:cyclase
MQTRRDFMIASGLMMSSAVLPRRAMAAWLDSKTTLTSKPIEGLRGGFFVGSLEEGGNVLALATEAGPVVIDAKHAYMASDLLGDIKTLTNAPPALLINTHHHADHSGGNWMFNSTGVKIIAHKNLNPRIPANLERHISMAQGHIEELKRDASDPVKLKAAEETVATIKSLKSEDFAAKQELNDGVTVIEHGGLRIEAYHYGSGHTDNDLVVFIPKHNLLHMGDLLFNNLHPFIDRSAKANSAGWQNSVKQAMKLGDDKTIVIPGHGEIADKTALPKQIEYFDQLRDIVENAIKEGKSKETIAAMKPEAFNGRGFEQLQGMALSAMYDEVSEGMH